jgi:hypothetical protein
MHIRTTATVLAVAATLARLPAPSHERSLVGDRVRKITRSSIWTPVASVPIAFRTFHPQGMVKIGESLYVSAVEVIDRNAGQGVGHLFKIDMSGRLVAELQLGEGAIYHPGGIDYDGQNIWIPVAEYRPDSRSIVYRVDARTMKAAEVFRVDDHIGAIVHDTDDHTLHGVSWGSRRFYRWTLRGVSKGRTLNTSHYIDYQDCKYAGQRRMLCSGVTEMRPAPDAVPFRLGGIDLIDLVDGRPLHQVPVLLWTAGGLDMTHNPVWLEPQGNGLRGYFMPEDDRSTLYIYDVDAP